MVGCHYWCILPAYAWDALCRCLVIDTSEKSHPKITRQRRIFWCRKSAQDGIWGTPADFKEHANQDVIMIDAFSSGGKTQWTLIDTHIALLNSCSSYHRVSPIEPILPWYGIRAWLHTWMSVFYHVPVKLNFTEMSSSHIKTSRLGQDESPTL